MLCARILAAGESSTALARLRVVPRVPVGFGRLTMLLLLVHVARLQIVGIGVGGVGVHLHSLFSSLHDVVSRRRARD
jgi:hypothetical protein